MPSYPSLSVPESLPDAMALRAANLLRSRPVLAIALHAGECPGTVGGTDQHVVFGSGDSFACRRFAPPSVRSSRGNVLPATSRILRDPRIRHP